MFLNFLVALIALFVSLITFLHFSSIFNRTSVVVRLVARVFFETRILLGYFYRAYLRYRKTFTSSSSLNLLHS